MSKDAVVVNIENGIGDYDLTIGIYPFGKKGGIIQRTYSPNEIGQALGGLPARLRGTISPGDMIILTSQHKVRTDSRLLDQRHLEALAEHFSDIYAGPKVRAYSSRVAILD